MNLLKHGGSLLHPAGFLRRQVRRLPWTARLDMIAATPAARINVVLPVQLVPSGLSFANSVAAMIGKIAVPDAPSLLNEGRLILGIACDAR